MSPRARPQTMLEVAVANVGVFKAGTALSYLVLWTWGIQAMGPEMTTEQFGEHFLLSRTTAFRYRRAILDAFDGRDVDRLVEQVSARTAEMQVNRTKRGSVKAAGQLAGLVVQ